MAVSTSARWQCPKGCQRLPSTILADFVTDVHLIAYRSIYVHRHISLLL